MNCLTAAWPTQMPFSPAPREFRSEFLLLKTRYIRERKGRKLDSLSVDAFSLGYLDYLRSGIYAYDVFMNTHTPSFIVTLWIQQNTCMQSEEQFADLSFQRDLKYIKKTWTGLQNLETGQSRCFISAVMGLMWHLKYVATLIITPLFGDGCCVRVSAASSRTLWTGSMSGSVTEYIWPELRHGLEVGPLHNYKHAYFRSIPIMRFRNHTK